MKKAALVIALLSMVLGTWGTSQVWAKGAGKGPGPAASSQVTWEQRQQFLNDTAPLRQSLWEKQSQLRTLVAKPDSDPAAIGTLEKEIYGLREQLRDSAQKAGFTCPMGGPGAGCGSGMGMGMGGGMGRGRCGW